MAKRVVKAAAESKRKNRVISFSVSQMFRLRMLKTALCRFFRKGREFLD